MQDATSTLVIEATKDHVIAVFRRVILIVFERETTLAAAAAYRRALDLLDGEYPNGIATLTIVAENAPLPAQGVREALALAMRAAGKRIQRSAVYFEGDGFRAAVVRGVATGLSRVATLPYPHKVFKTIEEAAAWLAPELGDRELLRAVDVARGNVVTIA